MMISGIWRPDPDASRCFLLKIIIILLTSLLLLSCSTSSKEFKKPFSKSDFEKILFEYGAFPYTHTKGTHFFTGKAKDIQIDINGWISPFYELSLPLTDIERNKYNFPPKRKSILSWFHKYKELLNYDEYKNRLCPEYVAILYFLLEIQLYEKIDENNSAHLICIAQANMGLEDLVVRILKNKKSFIISDSIFIKLKEVLLYKYYLLEDLFWIPNEEEIDYKKYLDRASQNEALAGAYRWFLLRRSYQQSQKNEVEFILQSINYLNSETKEWIREYMFSKIIEIRNNSVLGLMHTFLEKDNDTRCRIAILAGLCQVEYCDEKILAIINGFARGKTKCWHGINVKHLYLEPISWQMQINNYLNCIRELPKYKDENEKIIEIQGFLEKISDKSFGNKKKYFSYFKLFGKKGVDTKNIYHSFGVKDFASILNSGGI